MSLEEIHRKTDEITFWILADTVAKDIATTLKQTINRNKKLWFFIKLINSILQWKLI